MYVRSKRGPELRPLFVFLLLVGSLLLASLSYVFVTWFTPRHISLPEITEITGIAFPEGVRLVNSRMTNRFSHEVLVKAEIDSALIETFLGSLPDDVSISRTRRIDVLASAQGPAWWDPGMPRKFISVFVRPANHFPTSILISLDNEQHALLYVYHSR